MMDLICIPFAGGSKYSYNVFREFLPPFVRMIPLEWPGRGARFKQILRTDIYDIVEDLFAQVKDRIDVPYMVYGHSMGALVAYLLVKRVASACLREPEHIFFTGCAAPASFFKRKKGFYKLPEGEFIEGIRRLDGVPTEILDDPNLMRIFLPILRADFQAMDSFKYISTQPWNIPVSVYAGEQEEISEEDLAMWQQETSFPIETRYFPGGHFFIYAQTSLMMDAIVGKITGVSDRNGFEKVC